MLNKLTFHRRVNLFVKQCIYYYYLIKCRRSINFLNHKKIKILFCYYTCVSQLVTHLYILVEISYIQFSFNACI